ncbi:MAG: NADP-dependent isocitrate dehydrogenase [Burkholderiales bacterium]
MLLTNQVAASVSTAEILKLQSPFLETARSGHICVARGDGIGPEIMDATLEILFAAGAELDVHGVEIGAQALRQGFSSGISPLAWRVLKERKVLLKAPTSGVAGDTAKSPNATIRKSLGLFANIRPSIAYYPYVATRHPNMRVAIVRECQEDVYAGIEHRQTHDVAQCLKLISRSGSERVIRYAFEFARLNQRRKVSCFTKDTVMKMTDGIFRRAFEEVSRDFPNIEHEHLQVDTGMTRLVMHPEDFDVVVVPNLYGDILSDISGQMAASLAVSAAASIGYYGAMFEAAHGSAQDLAGKNVANPSGLLHSAVMMMHYIGQGAAASRVHQAWLRTVEDGIHTADAKPEHPRAKQVGTQEFAREVVSRLGARARFLPSRYFALPRALGPKPRLSGTPNTGTKHLVGTDMFLDWRGTKPEVLARKLRSIGQAEFTLTMISNRGLAVWPQGMHQSVYTDHWLCRFVARDGTATPAQIVDLLRGLVNAQLDVIKTENLYDFQEEPGSAPGHLQQTEQRMCS